MLARKSRPVPSKAALQVLYQLAYISSGAAVGVAALCAEERRRRTQLVQKIADNAKRIRQSPRHHHNAAAAVQVSDECMVGSGHKDWVQERQGEPGEWKRRRRKIPEAGPEGGGAARSPELPSVVEDAYQQTQDGKMEQGLSKRRPKHRLHAMSGHPSGTAASADPDAESSAEAQALQSESAKVYPCNYWRRRNTLQVSDGGPALTHADGRVHGSSASQPRILKIPWAKTFEDNQLRTEHQAAAEQFPLLAATGRASLDVESFFSSVSTRNTPTLELLKAAEGLYARALEHAMFDDLRFLTLWRLSHRNLTAKDAKRLCDAVRILSMHVDHKELVDFFSDIFCDRRYLDAVGSRAAPLALSVLEEAMTWPVEERPEKLGNSLIDPVLQTCAAGEVHALVSERCRGLADEGNIQAAVDLFKALSKYTQTYPGNHVLVENLDYLLNAAISSQSLLQCARLLRTGKGMLPS